MSYRKTKLIQERNILLERKYIMEQVPPPQPVGGTTTPPPAQAPTTTPTKEITFDMVMDVYTKKTFCSNFKNLDPNKTKEVKKEDKILFYYPTTDGNGILCVDNERSKI